MPKRIQRKRSKGWRMGDAVYVGRGSKYGNPYRVGDSYEIRAAGPYGFREHRQIWERISPALAVDLYRIWLSYMHTGDTPRNRPLPSEIEELRGKDLACWCPLAAPCHADVLLELANGDPE